MDPVLETKRRVDIARTISLSLEGTVKGIILGGSMGFGQNYSVTAQSDIDMVVVTGLDRVDDLTNTEYVQGRVPTEVLDLFRDGEINSFWVTREIDNVEVNTFIYEEKGYVDFCLLKGGLKTFKKNKPSATQTSYGFDGKPVTFDRKVASVAQGFIYEKPALADGKYWGGVPRQDFFYSGQVMYEDGFFFANLEKEVWKSAVQQLVKEYGQDPDLDEANILNTHYTYQTQRERLPPAVVDKIRQRTIVELGKLG